MVFDRLIWKRDRVLLDDLVFRLELEKQLEKDATWDQGENCFNLYKVKWIVDNYAKFWSTRKDFQARNIFEIGIWDGGSIALWFEHFQPKKFVAIDRGDMVVDGVDIVRTDDSAYFKRYVTSRGLQERIKTYWGVDQANTAKLREIVAREFEGPLDLVIDDGSHQYRYTKTTFEALFPLLRPGGLYIVEDWGWSHWKDYQGSDHEWVKEPPLTQLITELVEANGSPERFLKGNGSLAVMRTVIATVHSTPDFVAIERGDVSAQELADFKLAHCISRRPQDEQGRIAADYAELHERYVELEKGYYFLDQAYKDVERGYTDVQHQQVPALEIRCAELQREYDKLLADYQLVEKCYDNLRYNDIPALQSEHTALQTAHADLEAEYADLKASHTNLALREIPALETLAREQQATIGNLEAVRQDLQAKANELETQLLAVRTAYRELQTEHDDLDERLRNLKTGYDDLEQRHLPLTYFSGSLRHTARMALGKVRGLFSWSRAASAEASTNSENHAP
jgi:cephalosporin hydroxylase